MKRKIVLTSIILILLTLFSSCNLTPMEDGRSVNEYIFPYINFTLSDDGSYYSASILEDAAVESVYIPSYVDDFAGSIPVRFFNGFENDKDIENLKSTTFESSSTVIKLSSLDQAGILETITYNEVAEENTIWENLPDLVHTEDKEFLGWFLVKNGARIHNGDVMVPGYTALYAGWGTHTFSDMIPGKEPTCTQKGYKAYHYCKTCSYTTYTELPPLGHSLEVHEAADSTCTAVGYRTTCYECTRCGLFFSDSGGKEEVEKDDVIIPLKSHTWSGEYGWNETSHWYICSVCGGSFDEEEHSFTSWVDTGDGKHVSRECRKCSYSERAEKEHKWSIVEKVSPTCTGAGHEAYYMCENHSGEYTRSIETIEIVDWKTLEKDIYIPPTGHSFEEDYCSDETSHWHICSICGASSGKEDHEFEYTFVVDTDARSMVVERSCIKCKREFQGEASRNPSAFDITASFGAVSVTKTSYNTWSLSYTAGGAYDCYWTDDKGNELIHGKDPFSISYTSGGKGRIMVYCHEIDENNREVDVAFASLTTY